MSQMLQITNFRANGEALADTYSQTGWQQQSEVRYWTPALGQPCGLSGGQLAPTPKDTPAPNHGRVSRENLRSVYVVKGVRSLLTYI